MNHQYRVDVINRQYKDCLAAAQTEEDKAECEQRHDNAMEEENDRWSNTQAVLKEIKSCQECQIIILNKKFHYQ